jgi:NADH dehydrogenase [ubiquinone] 1 alpha subcomplex assembly factor 7
VDARDAVAAAIRDHGPISFAEYMEIALSGSGGFFEEPPIGADGDFITSPHVHPVFAQLLAVAVEDLRERLGAPRPFRVTEVGAGDGTLARGLLDHVAGAELEYTAVETSLGARRSLSAIDGIRVADRLYGAPHVIFANELLDNLPFRRLRGTAAGPREVLVGLDGDRLVERLAEETADVDVAPDDGEELTAPDGALRFVDDVAARLAHPGYALLIDYGGVGEPGGPPHGYRGHRPVEDLLDRPGTADITSGVDFALLTERAERAGLVAFPSVTQRHALTALGFDRWIQDELATQATQLNQGAGIDAVRTWSGRSRATLLVDPSALGRFRWLLLGTPGTTSPSWI